MKFERYGHEMARSFALRAFNGHETEINQHYWSFKVISEYAAFVAREASKLDGDAQTGDIFRATGPDARRIPPTAKEWLGARDALENWLRISAVASASSYLESYIRQVTRSALMSDPLCRFGATRTLDGLVLLKLGKEIDFGKELELITKGDWNARISGFIKIFGACPPGLSSNISKLEEIRRIRNEFAHGFGRSLDAPAPTNHSVGVSIRINATKLSSYLGTISKVASDIDSFLLKRFIGNFELLHYFHEIKNTPRLKRDNRYSITHYLKVSLGRNANISVSKEFCRSLIAYYEDTKY